MNNVLEFTPATGPGQKIKRGPLDVTWIDIADIEQSMTGLDPRDLLMVSAQHTLSIIRKCESCQGGLLSNVINCPNDKCALHTIGPDWAEGLLDGYLEAKAEGPASEDHR